MFHVLAISSFHEKGLALLRNRPDLLKLTILTDTSPESIAKAIPTADAITIRTAPLTKELLSLAPNLKIVSRHGVGTDNIDVAYLSTRKIPVAIAIDSNVGSVGEHTLMMMLALAKDAFAGDRATRTGDYHWRDKRTPVDLAGRTVLVMGFGRIGQKVASLCRMMDMRVLAFDPYITKSPVDGVEMVRDFRAVLPEVDFLTLHMPGTPETKGLIGPKELAAIKKGAFLINCARGGMVDEDLLCQALDSGQLGGAGLDVFAQEPPDISHPLFRQERTILSPHNAALTEECAIRMATQAAQNVIDCLEGKLAPRVVINRRQIGME